jgi:RNA polymerase sigma-70 factor (ECF subfamily)
VARLTPHLANASATEIWERTRLIESANDILPLATPVDGETLTFEQLVARFEPRVRQLAFRLLGWRDEVDDVTQDVFLAAFRSTPRFRGEAQLWTWLMRITINQCRTQQRKRYLRWKKLKTLLSRQWHLSAAASADEGNDRDETKARVHQAVAQLGAKDREVIVLYHLEEMDVNAMSALLGLTVNNVNVRLHRARERLRKLLSDVM